MTTCRHCSRRIEKVEGLWIDPEATGDDSVWRETCDQHDTFEARHEPTLTRDEAIAVLQDVAGGLNDGHARWPVPELGSVIGYLKDGLDRELLASFRAGIKQEQDQHDFDYHGGKIDPSAEEVQA